MARNALGRGLGALIREPEVAAQAVPPGAASYPREDPQPQLHRRKAFPADRYRSIST